MKQLVFENYGGHYQPRIEKPDDLEQVLELHEARWVATSAPIFGLNCNPAFLAQLDHNRDGRIRVDEVRHKIRWLFKHLTNRQRLAEKGDVLRLNEIDVGHDSGQKLRAASKAKTPSPAGNATSSSPPSSSSSPSKPAGWPACRSINCKTTASKFMSKKAQ